MYTFYNTRKYHVSVSEFNNRFLAEIYDKSCEKWALLSRGFGETERSAFKQARGNLK